MHIVPISEPADPQLRDYIGLTDVSLRRLTEPEDGLYIAESTKVIQRALTAGHRPRSVLLQQKWLDELQPLLVEFDIPVFLAAQEILGSITGFAMHRGALASMHRPVLPQPADVLRDARRVVVLEDIVDHTNVGAIFRAVAGLGADAVLVTPRCADPLYRRSVRVSMGAVLQVPWTRLAEWPDAASQLHDAGFTIAALALDAGAVTLDAFAADPPERVALLLGTEGDGLSRGALETGTHPGRCLQRRTAQHTPAVAERGHQRRPLRLGQRAMDRETQQRRLMAIDLAAHMKLGAVVIEQHAELKRRHHVLGAPSEREHREELSPGELERQQRRRRERRIAHRRPLARIPQQLGGRLGDVDLPTLAELDQHPGADTTSEVVVEDRKRNEAADGGRQQRAADDQLAVLRQVLEPRAGSAGRHRHQLGRSRS